MYFEMKSRSVANEPLFALAQKSPGRGLRSYGGGERGGEEEEEGSTAEALLSCIPRGFLKRMKC